MGSDARTLFDSLPRKELAAWAWQVVVLILVIWFSFSDSGWALIYDWCVLVPANFCYVLWARLYR